MFHKLSIEKECLHVEGKKEKQYLLEVHKPVQWSSVALTELVLEN